MNGLEAIKAMQEGKVVTTGTNIFKIEEGNVLSSYAGSFAELNDGVFRVACGFDFSLVYEEYQPKLTGWERKEAGRYYFVGSDCYIFSMMDHGTSEDNRVYDKANYFATVGKAKEINYKQELSRKLQRFSDKNGGSEIDWTHEGKRQYFISFDYDKGKFVIDSHLTFRAFGAVYFASHKVAEQALETFKEDLIKYYTHDWSKGE